MENSTALIQIIAWYRTGDKPSSKPMTLLYWRTYASLDLNEFWHYGNWRPGAAAGIVLNTHEYTGPSARRVKQPQLNIIIVL